MLTWVVYLFKPIFVGFLEISNAYVVVDGLGDTFFIPKFVTSKSHYTYIRRRIKNLANKLKTFFQILHVKGIGFKVYYYWKTKSLYFNLGYNHICKYCLENIASVKVRKQYFLLFTKIISIIYYVNEIKNLRFPDPYRGKGIRFRFQEMKFKPGKQR